VGRWAARKRAKLGGESLGDIIPLEIGGETNEQIKKKNPKDKKNVDCSRVFVKNVNLLFVKKKDGI